MFLCQNDEYQPTTERQTETKCLLLNATGKPLTRLRVELAHRAVVTRGWGKGEESNFELVYFKLALLQIAIETIVCRVTVISKKKTKPK